MLPLFFYVHNDEETFNNCNCVCYRGSGMDVPAAVFPFYVSAGRSNNTNCSLILRDTIRETYPVYVTHTETDTMLIVVTDTVIVCDTAHSLTRYGCTLRRDTSRKK